MIGISLFITSGLRDKRIRIIVKQRQDAACDSAGIVLQNCLIYAYCVIYNSAVTAIKIIQGNASF